jgi:Bifunctional DNA primase/polymerase, N-terminal/AAA domain
VTAVATVNGTPHMASMALFYAGAGIKVFPVNDKKEPLTPKGTPERPGGFHWATTDRAQVEKWWTRWPNAGIATPDFDVVDVDLYKPACKPTWKRIQPLIPKGTPHNRTGRGGLQFFFKAGTLRDGKIGPGVDNRYAGRNYVLLPPSQNEGGPYEAIVSVIERRPRPAPVFPSESGASSEFQHLREQMDSGAKITEDRNKATWWKSVQILRALPPNTDLDPVVELVQSWVDANCGGNLDDVHTKKQVAGAADFVAKERRGETRTATAARRDDRPRDAVPVANMAGALTWERLSDIVMRSIVFLDKPLWQASAFHLVVGRKGVGKGTVLADLAARTTRGELGEKRNVVWIGSEDSAAIDIKPRVVAAKGDPQRVILIKDWIQLPRDIERLGKTLVEIGDVGLLIIDPVGNHITGKNSNSDTDIRDAIAPLNDLADEYETMIIGVRHLSEKEAKAGAIAAILGASAWVQVPRAVIGIARDRSDASLSHIQCLIGNRLPPETPGRVFRIEGVTIKGLENEITRAVWNGDSTESVEELLSGGRDAKQGVPAEQVQAVVLEELGQGERTREDLNKACKAVLGVNADTVYKSGLGPLKDEERIRARKDGLNGPWYWRLSDEVRTESQTAESQTVDPSPVAGVCGCGNPIVRGTGNTTTKCGTCAKAGIS